ncbi:MAG: helix-turn-helix transcriptional regulator [Anaerolineales bacterium]|nr:helix-turn-helix transcriptional regulator [Anaerolineales bacterium]
MDVTINNRFAVLLAEKQVKERRNIPLAEVAEDTGISRRALYAWENNDVHRFDDVIINALCRYFGIKPGDLLEYIEDVTPPPAKKKK